MVDTGRYLESLRLDGEAIVAAAGKDLTARVPTCPDWNEKELVEHTGGVHRFWCDIAERKLQDPSEARPEPAPSDEDSLVGWYRAGVTHLLHVLGVADPEAPVWSWSARKNIGFIQRRMAQETAVHRWDAENGVGVARSIDADIAVDGIDEELELFAPAEGNPLGGRGETIHLHATDAEGEWLVRLEPSGISVTRGHEKGDAAIRGTASDLLLLLWRRVDLDRVELHGDRALVERFLGWQDLE